MFAYILPTNAFTLHNYVTRLRCLRYASQIRLGIYHVLSRIINELTTVAKLLSSKSVIVYYCSLKWHFCSLDDLNRIERVQYRSLRFVCYDLDAYYRDLSSRAGHCYTMNAYRPLLGES